MSQTKRLPQTVFEIRILCKATKHSLGLQILRSKSKLGHENFSLERLREDAHSFLSHLLFDVLVFVTFFYIQCCLTTDWDTTVLPSLVGVHGVAPGSCRLIVGVPAVIL